MKKILALALLFTFAACNVSFAAGTALPTNTITTNTGSQIYGGINQADADRDDAVLLGKMSKGVHFRCAFDGTAGLGYSAATKHNSGSKAYGTAHDSTAIYFQDIGTAGIPSLSAASNQAFDGTAWTTM